MQLRTLYPFVFALCAISCVAMDVDQAPNEQELQNPSSPGYGSRYCLFLRVSGDRVIGIPMSLQDFFGEKIEIAGTLNPDTMTLLLPQLEEATVALVIEFLKTYELPKSWNQVTEKLQITPFDELIKIARTAAELNLYGLKPIVRDVIVDIFKGKELPPHAEIVATFQKLDDLGDYFTQPLKKLLFGDFKKRLRDKNPFFGVSRKQLIQISDQQTKDFCIAGNGATFFWATPDNRLKGYDLVSKALLFDLSTAPNLNSTTDFLINDTTILTTNYAGSLCCLAQQDVKMAIYDTQTKIFTVIDAIDVLTCIPNNHGNVLFVETTKGVHLNEKNKNGSFEVLKLLTLPDEITNDAYSNTFSILSACFSRNDTFLYVLYENVINKERLLCVYSVADARILTELEITKGNVRGWCVAPAQQEDHCWIFFDGSVKKMQFYPQSGKLTAISEISVGSAESYSLQVNRDESYLIINNKELVNIALQKTDCIYRDFIVFGSNPKSVIVKEKSLQQQGFDNFIQVPLRTPEFMLELDDLFERLSLVQVSTLEYLMETFSINPQAPTQPLVDFIKDIPKTLRDFVQAYCFPGIKLPRILEEKADRPAKRQKHS